MSFRAWQNLRDAIFSQAVNDYKAIYRAEIPETGECNVREIEAFLRSEYCEGLLSDVSMSGEGMLHTLHEWRREYAEVIRNDKEYREKHTYKPFPTKG